MTNRYETHFEEYREWQWIKHLILRQYAQAWSVIVGKRARSIFVVDTCAGAGTYTDPDTGEVISEGSPVFFARRAKAYTEERGPGKTMRLICCEKNPKNYAALAENLRPYEPHVTTLPHAFQRHVPFIAETLGSEPALILLDPIGVADIPADAWRPLLERTGKTDLFVVLHFSGLHRVGGFLLPDGTLKPGIAHARGAVQNMDRAFNGPKWREIAITLVGEEHREERERLYVQLFFDEVIGTRHRWKGSVDVRARYSSPVKYWLVHASDDEKPYELMNDTVVRVKELLLNRENADETQLVGFAEADLKAHRAEIQHELKKAIFTCVSSTAEQAIPFRAICDQLASRFFGRVRWKTGYGAAIRALCEDGVLARQASALRAKFEDYEIIQAIKPDPAPEQGAQVVPIRRVA